ncbi:hypothetical protein BC781_1011375 [Sediminitomix flava]|uniref:Uncharacterized protein n=1 Tax=Sediminitomix flava TaxID=379075 RepID=A0A315ZIE4_SEDFL|nr:hypothetical protein BC781_1011375 [Sediminitomix flava]
MHFKISTYVAFIIDFIRGIYVQTVLCLVALALK